MRVELDLTEETAMDITTAAHLSHTIDELVPRIDEAKMKGK